MDLTVHHPAVISTTGLENGRDADSLSESGRSATKRSYKALGTAPGLGTVLEVAVSTIQAPVKMADGSKTVRDFLKVTYTYMPSFEVDDAEVVQYSGSVKYTSSISVPLVSGLSAARFEELFQASPIELLRQVDDVADELVYPYDAWIQGVPILKGAVD